jgi:hypothetical protein
MAWDVLEVSVEDVMDGLDWIYLTFRSGHLYEDDGALYTARQFASVAEAEQWLVDEDVPATIR